MRRHLKPMLCVWTVFLATGGLTACSSSDDTEPATAAEGTEWPIDVAVNSQCTGASPSETFDAPGPEFTDQNAPDANSLIGQPHPEWYLTDVQPESCGHELTYGMPAFRGRVTVLALLASW